MVTCHYDVICGHQRMVGMTRLVKKVDDRLRESSLSPCILKNIYNRVSVCLYFHFCLHFAKQASQNELIMELVYSWRKVTVVLVCLPIAPLRLIVLL